MTNELSRRTQLIIVLLALLIHLLLFLPFIINQPRLSLRLPKSEASLADQTPDQETDEHTPTPAQPYDDWVELKAGASQLASVIYYDEQPTVGFGQQNQTTPPIIIQAPPEEQDSDPQEVNNEPEQEPLESTPEDSTPPSLELLEAEQSMPEVITDTMPELVPIPEYQAQERQKKETAPKPPARKPKKRVAKPQQPPITLADITRGYLNQLRNDGNSTISMRGRPGSGQPPAEQIMYQRFMEKFHWHLQNSVKINRSRLYLTDAVKAVMELFIELNQNGSLKEIKILKGSGSVNFDQFVIFIFKDASSSFPPFPKSLDPALRIFTFTIDVNIPRGAHNGAGLTLSLC